MPSTVPLEETAITIALIALVGALFAPFATHRLSFWRERHARRATACDAFRSAVLAQLGSIYPNASVWPGDIDAYLRSRFTASQTAVENFRPFVPWWRRWLFDRAWFCYRCATGRKIDTQCYHHYMAFVDNPNYRTVFHANVKCLLSYANET